MGICFVIPDAFVNKLKKEYDPYDAQQLVSKLDTKRTKASTAPDLFTKDYTGYDNIKQIRLSDWRVVSLYIQEFNICELVQLNYVYRKNESNEPNEGILRDIDDCANRLFEEAADWPPADESEYLDEMRTQLPSLERS